MKFQRRRGVSVIIATLLLIAIAVAAGIIVYVFVNSLAGGLTAGGGQQTAERLQMQSYNFALSPPNCSCSGNILDLFLLNSGSSASTISAVYYDGTLQGLAAVPAATNTAFVTNNAYYDSSAAEILDYTTASACVSGAPATYAFCAVTGGSAASGGGQLYNVGATGQIVIVFAAANTPVAGTSHTVKIVSSTGATNVFSVSAGRTG